jgi:hypothetical protein
MTKKDNVPQETEVSAPVESVPKMPFSTVNVSSKKLPAEYLDRATGCLAKDGGVVIAGLGNASTTAMKVAIMLLRLGYARGGVDIVEKTMPAQRWVADSKDPQDGAWVDDPTRPARPVPQLLITLDARSKL